MNGINMSDVTNYMFGSTQVSEVYLGSTLIWPLTPHDYSQDYLTFELLEPTKIFIETSHYIDNDPNCYISYSIDNGSTWTNIMTQNGEIPELPTGTRILWKGNLSIISTHTVSLMTYHLYWGRYNIYGNVSSLYFEDNFVGNTTIYTHMYDDLFGGNTGIVSAKNLILPATNLSNAFYCYTKMFTGCSNMTIAPALPATTLANGCYDSMFAYCDSLTTPPEISAVTLATQCCHSMFNGCTSLTTAPALPATTLAIDCYWNMFNGCTSLTTAPALPATTLANNCYERMFYGCTSLTTAPELSATTLASNCYEYMFYGCTSLNNIKCLATDISASYCTIGWVTGVAATGTFTKAASMTNWTTGANGIPSGWTVQNYGPTPHDYSQDYLTIEVLDNGTQISFTQNSIEYSIDNGTTWGTMTTSEYLALNTGEKALFKASGLTPTSSVGIGTFTVNNGRINVSGNIMSMQDGDNFVNSTTISNKSQFRRLFYNCTNIVDVSNLILPATTLDQNCYQQMFSGCTSLTTAPELPATTLVSSCYRNMFYGCTSLTSAPELPATTLVNFCYNEMFSNCTSLTTAPALPATTLAQTCYASMFSGCTSLTTAPELPATTLVSYCYNYMFSGCTSLNYIKCLATNISASACTTNWLNNVAASGTFIKDASMTNWTTGNNGIPSGWTVQDAS